VLIETNISSDRRILIDVEATGGVQKDDLDPHHPDDIIPSAISLAEGVIKQLANIAKKDGVSKLSVTFGVRVDGNSMVSIARSPERGQLKISAEWSAS